VSDVPAWVLDFGHERRGVYVTFGTEMAQLAPWPAVIEAMGSIDADVVVTLGGQVDPDTLGPVPSNVRLERYVPQTFLLDRISAVGWHAGSGTLFATAARGIPQLCIPIAADQWENSDALAASGAAISLELHQRTADDIYGAMVTLLDGRQHASAALTLADAFSALPHPRDHVATIESLA
jgi:UDP:flavonoid glycosyltransferase YjiC (YdhE family)